MGPKYPLASNSRTIKYHPKNHTSGELSMVSCNDTEFNTGAGVPTNADDEHIQYEGDEQDDGLSNVAAADADLSDNNDQHSISRRHASVKEHSVSSTGPPSGDASVIERLEDDQCIRGSSISNGNPVGNYDGVDTSMRTAGSDDTDMRELGDCQEELGTDQKASHNVQDSQQTTNPDDNRTGCTLYVRNLPTHLRNEHVKEHFSQFGEVVDCRIVINPVTKDSRGFGFVSFSTPEIADMAMGKTDQVELEGKILRIEKARRNRPHDPTPGEYKGPTGASIKYDNRGRLKPGYVPYWDLPVPKTLHHPQHTSHTHYRQGGNRGTSSYGPSRNYRGSPTRRPSFGRGDIGHHQSRGNGYSPDARHMADGGRLYTHSSNHHNEPTGSTYYGPSSSAGYHSSYSRPTVQHTTTRPSIDEERDVYPDTRRIPPRHHHENGTWDRRGYELSSRERGSGSNHYVQHRSSQYDGYYLGVSGGTGSSSNYYSGTPSSATNIGSYDTRRPSSSTRPSPHQYVSGGGGGTERLSPTTSGPARYDHRRNVTDRTKLEDTPYIPSSERLGGPTHRSIPIRSRSPPMTRNNPPVISRVGRTPCPNSGVHRRSQSVSHIHNDEGTRYPPVRTRHNASNGEGYDGVPGGGQYNRVHRGGNQSLLTSPYSSSEYPNSSTTKNIPAVSNNSNLTTSGGGDARGGYPHRNDSRQTPLSYSQGGYEHSNRYHSGSNRQASGPLSSSDTAQPNSRSLPSRDNNPGVPLSIGHGQTTQHHRGGGGSSGYSGNNIPGESLSTRHHGGSTSPRTLPVPIGTDSLQGARHYNNSCNKSSAH